MDTSFRYKMPAMLIKTEGRGNGIKTVILNLRTIAKSLNVDPSYPLKFIGIELGTQTKWDLSRALLNGSHSLSTLSLQLDHFIQQFVLCSNCRLPELIWKIGKSSLKTNCSACGHASVLKEPHKMISYIIKHPPSSPVVSIPQISITSSTSLSSSSSSIEHEDWSDESSLSVTIHSDDNDEKADVPVLQRLMEEKQHPSRILSELRLLELSRGLDIIQKYTLLLETMLTVYNTLYIPLLLHISKDLSSKMTIFHALEQVISSSPKRILQIPIFLHALYDSDFFDEEALLCWHQSPPESSYTISRSAAIALRKQADPFIKWLTSPDNDVSD